MLANDAVKIFYKQFPGFLVRSCTLYKGLFFIDATYADGEIPMTSYSYAVDKETGDIVKINPIEFIDDHDEYIKAYEGATVFFDNNAKGLISI